MKNFKVGDRVMVSNIEDVGTVQMLDKDAVCVKWNNPERNPNPWWYPEYQLRLAKPHQSPESANLREKRKVLRKLYRQLEAEIPDRCLQERLAKITDML